MTGDERRWEAMSHKYPLKQLQIKKVQKSDPPWNSILPTGKGFQGNFHKINSWNRQFYEKCSTNCFKFKTGVFCSFYLWCCISPVTSIKTKIWHHFSFSNFSWGTFFVLWIFLFFWQKSGEKSTFLKIFPKSF